MSRSVRSIRPAPPSRRQVPGGYGRGHVERSRVSATGQNRPSRRTSAYGGSAFESGKSSGSQRSYWGTDLTNTYAKGSYRQRISHFTEELSFLSESNKNWVMGRAIVQRLKWT